MMSDAEFRLAVSADDSMLRADHEFGGARIQRDVAIEQRDEARAKLARIETLCNAQGEDSYVMVYALRAVLGKGEN